MGSAFPHRVHHNDVRSQEPSVRRGHGDQVDPAIPCTAFRTQFLPLDHEERLPGQWTQTEQPLIVQTREVFQNTGMVDRQGLIPEVVVTVRIHNMTFVPKGGVDPVKKFLAG